MAMDFGAILGYCGAAAISGGFTFMAAGRGMKKVHKAIETNHGKRPGEYLEMVGEIREHQKLIGQQCADTADAVDRLASDYRNHLSQDKDSFTSIHAAIDGMGRVIIEDRTQRGQ